VVVMAPGCCCRVADCGTLWGHRPFAYTYPYLFHGVDHIDKDTKVKTVGVKVWALSPSCEQNEGHLFSGVGVCC